MKPGNETLSPSVCAHCGTTGRHTCTKHPTATQGGPSAKPDFKGWCESVDEAASLMSDETGRSVKDFSLWELMVWLTRKRQEQEASHIGPC